MLFNIETLGWDQEICQRFGIPAELLPEAVPPGTVVGGLKKSLRQELGLSGEVPVVAVGGDQQAAAVGLGVVQPGPAGVNSGTGSFVLAHSDRPAFDPRQRVICTAATVAGKWLLEGSIITSGCVYRWFRDNFGKAGSDAEITRSGAGARGLMLLPHFAGSAAPYWDPQASGALYGLNLGHTRADVARAVMEGICLEIWKSVRIIEDLTAPLSEVRVSGGATRSPVFGQIQADVYGKPVLRASCEEASALGAMIVGSAAIGLYPDVPTAAREVVSFDRKGRKFPDPRAHQVYEQLLARHENLYQALHSLTIRS
jgi:sugar (pentulose or hexulose) kinase